LKPIRAFTRSLARTSFASVLSLAAALLSLLLSSMFTLFYFSKAWDAYQISARDSGAQVAELISSELAFDQTRAIEIALQSTLSDRALILAPDGTSLMGDLSADAKARALNFPLEHDGEALGTLLYLPSSSFQPPIP
jgi:hypothetical protein